MDPKQRFLRRAEHLLDLAAQVERAAEELIRVTTTDTHWIRQRRTNLLKAAIEYGVAMHRNLRRPPLRKKSRA